MKKKEKQTETDSEPVTVRVEPQGYSYHEFVLPASDLRSPHFATLMAKAQKEYGVRGTVYAIPCRRLDDFILAMVKAVTRAPFKPSAEDAPVDEPSSPPRRRTLGWFLARSH